MKRMFGLLILFAAVIVTANLYSDTVQFRISKQYWEDGMKNPGAAKEEKNSTVYEFNMKDIDGNQTPLSLYKGKVILIVNVASLCGFTPQYEGLQSLYEKYKDRGFVVLGFPANDFKNQEPGMDGEIKAFCAAKYHVTFPMFSKITVKGEDKHPLYGFLTEKETDPDFSGEITWNFNKFLIGQNGKVIGRFDSKTKPEDPQITAAIERAMESK